MGDRGNIKLCESGSGTANDKSIYLYTHWGVSQLAEALKRGLAAADKAGRLGDVGYCNMFVIESLVGQKMTDGFAISISRDDNDRDVWEVDYEMGCVRQLSRFGWHDKGWKPVALNEWTFGQFLAE